MVVQASYRRTIQGSWRPQSHQSPAQRRAAWSTTCGWCDGEAAGLAADARNGHRRARESGARGEPLVLLTDVREWCTTSVDELDLGGPGGEGVSRVVSALARAGNSRRAVCQRLVSDLELGGVGQDEVAVGTQVVEGSICSARFTARERNLDVWARRSAQCRRDVTQAGRRIVRNTSAADGRAALQTSAGTVPAAQSAVDGAVEVEACVAQITELLGDDVVAWARNQRGGDAAQVVSAKPVARRHARACPTIAAPEISDGERSKDVAHSQWLR